MIDDGRGDASSRLVRGSRDSWVKKKIVSADLEIPKSRGNFVSADPENPKTWDKKTRFATTWSEFFNPRFFYPRFHFVLALWWSVAAWHERGLAGT